ncbi:MAG: hypothetical protein R6X32_08565 [Chloroflexota bacterium]
MQGRDYVLPDDIKRLAGPVLAHRCLVQPESALRGRQVGDIINQVLTETELDLGRT